MTKNKEAKPLQKTSTKKTKSDSNINNGSKEFETHDSSKGKVKKEKLLGDESEINDETTI